MVCHTIRNVSKDADVQSVRQVDAGHVAPALTEVVTARRARQRIAHVRGAHGDAMTTSNQRVRECVHDTRNAAIRPGVGEVGRDVQDAEWRH